MRGTRFARAADVFTGPVSGSRSETRTSLPVMPLANQKATATLAVVAVVKLLVSVKASGWESESE